MDQIWIIYIIIFCAVLLAVQGAYWTFAEQKEEREAVNRRLLLSQQNTNAREVFETLRRERELIGFDGPQFARLRALVLQTGLPLNEKIVIASTLSLGALFFLILGLVLGYGLTSLVLAVVLAGLSLMLFLVVVRRKRIARFAEQLPDAIDVIVRGVKSGYPFTVALTLVAREMSDPIGTEFGMTSDEIDFGSDIGMALDNLYRRVGHEELLYLIMAIKIQTETGGNLAEILSRLARLIRERAMLRLKVRSITAEGRLSGVFLSAFPFVLFGIVYLISPDYYRSVLHHPAIVPALIFGLILLMLGNIIIYRMVNFKV